MATKASRIALSASNLSSTGNITADLFDDIDSINFLRSDESDTMTGNLSVSGNVGIGTSSPAALLSVYNASNPYANFADAANYLNVGVITSNYGLINSSLPISFQISDTERMRIDSSGNVGIGTSSPSSATWSNFLQVEATYPGVVYNSTAGGSNYKFSTGVDDNVWIVRDETAGATRMLINSSGLVGIGTSSPTHALTVKSSGVLGKFEAVDQAAELRIESPTVDVIGLYTGTNDALTFGTASTERMRIDSSGNVGIGTAPSVTLHVKSPNPVFGLETTGTVSAGGTVYSELKDSTGTVFTSGFAGLANCYQFATSAAAGFMRFMTGAGAERMRIDSSGNVGIGTSTPIASTNKTVLGVQGAWGGQLDIMVGTVSHAQFGTDNYSTGLSARIQSKDGIIFKVNGGTVAMKIDSNGTITQNTTSVTPVSANFVTANSNCDVTMQSANSSSVTRLRNGTNDFQVHTSGGLGLAVAAGGQVGVFGSGASNYRGDMAMTSGTGVSTKRWGFGGGTGTNSTVFYIINEGNVGQYMDHGSQSWTAHSDERIKENITDVGTVLPSLMNMRCVKYNLISNPTDTKIGFIAQDWEAAFPEVVDENEHLVLEADGKIGTSDTSDSTTPVKAMAYTETIPLLLKAIQELKEENNALKTRIEALEK